MVRGANRLWEGNERKTPDCNIKTFEILIKFVKVPPLQLGAASSKGSHVREEKFQDCEV